MRYSDTAALCPHFVGAHADNRQRATEECHQRAWRSCDSSRLADTLHFTQLLFELLVVSPPDRACSDAMTFSSESFFGTLKQELIFRCELLSRAQAQTAICECLEVFCNPKRHHSKLGFLSPNDFDESSPVANSRM